jgi:hypothetical protein
MTISLKSVGWAASACFCIPYELTVPQGCESQVKAPVDGCGREPWSVSVREYELLIFDWDGTLVDSIGRIVTMHRAANDCELPRCTDEQVRGIIGPGLPEAIRCLAPYMIWPVRDVCAKLQRKLSGSGIRAISSVSWGG